MFTNRNSIKVGRSGGSTKIMNGRHRKRNGVVQANFGQSPNRHLGGQSYGGGSNTLNIGGIDLSTPYIDDLANTLLCQMYEDIYYHDPVAGAAVDLMSNLPFSPFKLNIPASKNVSEITEKYELNLNRLRINTLLPPAAREHMVYGAHLSMLIYKDSEKVFNDTVPIPYADTDIVDNILYARDPVIRVRGSERMRRFLNDNSETARNIVGRLDKNLVQTLRSGNFEMDPMSTIYFPRESFASTDQGVSYYRRILPMYLLEKVMFRGTITMANRRQSSVLHVQAGSDEWEPTPEELGDIIRLIQEADRDPIGAVIGTRNDVQVNELKQGGDFWKYTDITPDMDGRKLLALGINEAFLSGDASYNNMEQALSVFIEQLRAFREQTSSQFFYNKLFPLISITNGFTKEAYGGNPDDGRITAAGGRRFTNSIDLKMSDIADYVIPEIEWEKKLMPEGDQEQLQLMENLAEKGVPFGLRAWAAAGGFDLDAVITQNKAGIADEKRIKELEALRKETFGEDESNDSEEDDNFFSSLAGSREDRTLLPEVGIFDREFPEEHMENYRLTATGKKVHGINPHKKATELNKVAVQAMHRLAVTSGTAKKKYYPGLKRTGRI